MTGRDVLNSQKRRQSNRLLSGFSLFLIGIATLGILALINPDGEITIITGLVFGIPMLVGYVLLMASCIPFFSFRCPYCQENWRSANPFNNFSRRLDPRIMFCPYCGTSVDTDISNQIS